MSDHINGGSSVRGLAFVKVDSKDGFESAGRKMKVSIITPCFNSEKKIRQTIESVLNQTYKNIEYIIIDGASNDGTLDIIKEYVPRFDGRMKYVSEPDKGIYNAMNKGIRMSTGELIGIVNSDDFYEPQIVERMVHSRIDGVYQVIYSYCKILNNKDKIINIETNSHYDLDRWMIPHVTCFVSRDTYRRYGMFIETWRISADYELMLRYRKRGVVFTQIEEELASFRLGGVSRRKDWRLENAVIRKRYHCISIKEFLAQVYDYMVTNIFINS